jgi:NAD(P)-dependent dehydrogenase (short-subunit alcohol dehydrogenase family)
VLVTGPTSGLGRQVTDELAALGARVVLVGRNEERLNAVHDALVARHGVDLYPIVVADMGSLASVRAAAAQVLVQESRLDVLIDNAGAIFPDRMIGPDGIEATFATLVVGPFTLIRGLLPLLDRTAGSRVVAVTSGGQYAQGLDVDDLQYARGAYDGTRAYARAKRAQVALIREWARRFGGAGVRFDSMHPGWARTPGLVEALPGFARLMDPLLRTPAEGTDTLVWLATSTADETGGPDGSLWLDRRRRPFDRLPKTQVSRLDRHRLWELVVELSGVGGSDSTNPRLSWRHA